MHGVDGSSALLLSAPQAVGRGQFNPCPPRPFCGVFGPSAQCPLSPLQQALSLGQLFGAAVVFRLPPLYAAFAVGELFGTAVVFGAATIFGFRVFRAASAIDEAATRSTGKAVGMGSSRASVDTSRMGGASDATDGWPGRGTAKVAVDD